MSNRQRRKNREEIFKYLYQYQLNPDSFNKIDEEKTVTDFKKLKNIQLSIDKSNTYFESVDKEWSNRDMLEKIILHIGRYEILEIPDNNRVYTINESVNLAKKYCSKNSFRYINYMLDSLSNEKE